MTQANLVDGGARDPGKPRKRVQETSAMQFEKLRQWGTLDKRNAQVFKAVKALSISGKGGPTSCEIQRYLATIGAIPNDGNPNHIRPTLTRLADDQWLQRGPKRKSQVTGLTVLTWVVK